MTLVNRLQRCGLQRRVGRQSGLLQSAHGALLTWWYSLTQKSAATSGIVAVVPKASWVDRG
jgi:hypothetical protein